MSGTPLFSALYSAKWSLSGHSAGSPALATDETGWRLLPGGFIAKGNTEEREV
jgi:hypothetical protein